MKTLVLAISAICFTALTLTTCFCANHVSTTLLGQSSSRRSKNGSAGDYDKQLHSENIVYILSLLPYPDPEGRENLQPSWDEGPTLFIAEQLAVELINNNSDILNGYTLQLIKGDSGCNLRSKANLAFIENVLYHKFSYVPVGIVGPGCSNSALTVSSLTGREELSILTLHVAGSLLLSNRTLYKYSFGTLDSTEVFVQASLALIRDNQWDPVAILYDESREYYASTARKFERDLRSDNIAHSSQAVYDTFLPLDVIVMNRTRVIFLFVGPDFLSKIFCLAYHSDILFPIYQFIIVSRVTDEIQSVTLNYDGKTLVCTEEDITRVINGSLIIHYQLETDEYNTESGLSHQQFFELYKQRVSHYNRDNGLTSREQGGEINIIRTSFWAAAFFDAVWSMALAVNDSLEKVEFLLNSTGAIYGSELAEDLKRNLLEQDFSGLSGRITYNQSSGYVIRNVNVYQIDNNRNMNLIALYEKFNNSIVLTGVDGKFIEGTFRTESTIYSVPLILGAILMSITAMCFIVTLTLHILTIVYRKRKSVKASSIKLSHVAFIGCYLLSFGGIMNFIVECLSGIISPSMECKIFHVLNSSVAFGATLWFGPICARTWRLYRIYVHFNKPGKLISDWFLLSVILTLFLLNLLVAILWVVIDPFRPEFLKSAQHLQKVVDPQGNTEEYVIMEEVIVECELKQNYIMWFFFLFSFVILLMVLAFWLAFFTRHIPHKDFQTNSIMLLVYLATGFTVVCLILYFLFRINLFQFIVLNILLNVLVLLSCLFLFLPPIYPILKKKSQLLL